MPRKRNTNTVTTTKRFECIDPERNHNKFYELTAEMLLFGPTVTRRWGRIDSRRPRLLSKNYETYDQAKREIKAILRRRERRGYRVVADASTECTASEGTVYGDLGQGYSC